MCMGILSQHKVVKLSNPYVIVFHNKLHRSGFIWIKLIAIYIAILKKTILLII